MEMSPARSPCLPGLGFPLPASDVVWLKGSAAAAGGPCSLPGCAHTCANGHAAAQRKGQREAYIATFFIFAPKGRRLESEQPGKSQTVRRLAETSCGTSLNIRPSLSTAQQDMKSNLYFISLIICQCKEFVLFPLLLVGFFVFGGVFFCLLSNVGPTSDPRVTSLRLQDLPPGRHTCRSSMGITY